MKRLSRALVALCLGLSVAPEAQRRMPTAKQLIAHRGASGYAPEHTLAAYQVALEQHADFVEPDLAVSKDGHLICLHDDSLERTTNVEEVFPDRYNREVHERDGNKMWLANDFTLAEIKRLDAGSWMDATFAEAKVPTFDEMVTLVRGKAGIYPELKSPPLYTGRGVDMVRIFAGSLKKQRLDTVESMKSTPVIIQSFDEATIRRVSTDLPTIPRVFLTSRDDDVTDERLRELATFADGIAPDKHVIARHPGMVARAHTAGLTVTAWTFRADEETIYPNVRNEMSHFLYVWGVDALFTNHPDQFPRK